MSGEELSRSKKRISTTLSIQEKIITVLESFKCIIFYGTKYMVDKCYLAVKFDNEEIQNYVIYCKLIFPLCLM